MDERTLQFRVGLVVLAACIIGFVLILFFGEKGRFFQRHKTVYMWFNQAPGATEDTPVRKNGVLVGRVTSVQLLDEGGVLLTAQINAKYRIQRNEAAVIRTGSLIGDAVLEFVDSRDPSASRDVIEDGEFIGKTAVANDPVQVLVNLEDKVAGALGKMESASDKIVEAGGKIAQLADNVNTVVANNGDQFQRILQKTDVAMDHFHSAMVGIDALVGDPEVRQELKQSLQDLPMLLADAKETLSEARKTLNGFQQMTARADANLENLQKFTEPLGERGDKLVERVQNAVVNIDQLLTELVDFSRGLNSQEGSLGKLIHDRELYDRLSRAAENVEHSSRRLEPILNDVRIFTDKIARDPRQLGLKGAIDRRPTGTGSKHGLVEGDSIFGNGDE